MKDDNIIKIYIKYGVILVLFIGIIVVFNYLITPSMPVQIKNYLISKGYKVGEYEDLLVKTEGEKEYTFSLGDYTNTLSLESESDNVIKSLNATYNYKSESIIYSYRVNYSDYLNVYFKGTYKTDEFTCEKEFSTASLSSTEQENICSLARIDVELFKLESETLFTKYKYVDYIKNR